MALTRARTGCDLQRIDEVDAAIADFGARYLDRVYTPTEQESGLPGSTAARSASLAARFAAKEAVLKLLGTTDGVDPRSIEIGEDPSFAGRPQVRLSGRAATLAEEAGLGPIDVSLSHSDGFAMAVAVALATDDQPRGSLSTTSVSQETPNP